jgi:hypothetical protein
MLRLDLSVVGSKTVRSTWKYSEGSAPRPMKAHRLKRASCTIDPAGRVCRLIAAGADVPNGRNVADHFGMMGLRRFIRRKHAFDTQFLRGATVNGHLMATAFVSSTTCLSISLRLPPWKLPKLPANPLRRTGLFAMVAITFGRNPRLCFSACSVGLDFFGADSIV